MLPFALRSADNLKRLPPARLEGRPETKEAPARWTGRGFRTKGVIAGNDHQCLVYHSLARRWPRSRLALAVLTPSPGSSPRRAADLSPQGEEKEKSAIAPIPPREEEAANPAQRR